MSKTIKPIRNEEDHEKYLREIEALWNDESEEAQDRLEVLSILVEAFEERHWPIDPPGPIETIRFFMQQKGLETKDLEPYLGSRQRVSEVMSGKRSLSIAMVQRLHEGLGIPSDLLIARTAMTRAVGSTLSRKHHGVVPRARGLAGRRS